MPNVRHSTIRVGPANVFYREAGTEGQPVLLLLHGFANSSHYFRHLMPKVAGRFHVIAPDADVRFLDTGHFALETNVDDFASAILEMAVNA